MTIFLNRRIIFDIIFPMLVGLNFFSYQSTKRCNHGRGRDRASQRHQVDEEEGPAGLLGGQGKEEQVQKALLDTGLAGNV